MIWASASEGRFLKLTHCSDSTLLGGAVLWHAARRMIYPQDRNEHSAHASLLFPGRSWYRRRRASSSLPNRLQARRPAHLEPARKRSRCAAGHSRGHNGSERPVCGDGYFNGPDHLPVLPEAGAQRRRQLHRIGRRHEGLDRSHDEKGRAPQAVLRRHDLSSRDSGVHDSGRRSHWIGDGQCRLSFRR